jgi:hypothetical protein
MRVIRSGHHAPPYRALLASVLALVLSCGAALAGQPPGVAYNDPRIPTPDINGSSALLGPDGAVQARVGYSPAAANTPAAIRLVPGFATNGPTVLCEQYGSLSTAVPCNLVASGAGKIAFGNGSGPLLLLLDPGAATTAAITVTPGTISSSAAKIGTSAYGPIALTSNGAGVGIGTSTTATGPGCLAIGNSSYCSGTYSLVSGIAAYDFAQSCGLRIHSSGGSAGSNELWEQTLQVSTSAATPARLTCGGTAISFSAQSMPVQTNGHGRFWIDVECSKSGGDEVGWSVAGYFTRWGTASGNLLLQGVSGAGAPGFSTSALSGTTLAVVSDTTYQNFNVSVTLTGNAALLSCTAYSRWEQKVS